MRSKKDIEKSIRNAAFEMAPDKKDELLDKPFEEACGDEWYLEGAGQKKKKGFTRYIASAAAAVAVCVLLFVLVLRTGTDVDATVYLDINPSVSLSIDKDNKVLEAEAHNDDGRIILDDMDLKGSNLDVAVNALIGSMYVHGYLSESQSTVLVSVDSKDPERAEYLRKLVSRNIDDYLTSLMGKAAVYDQTIAEDAELMELAQEYGITPGKAYLIRNIVEKFPERKFDELAGMSMSKLEKLLKKNGSSLEDQVHKTVNPAPAKNNDYKKPSNNGGKKNETEKSSGSSGKSTDIETESQTIPEEITESTDETEAGDPEAETDTETGEDETYESETYESGESGDGTDGNGQTEEPQEQQTQPDTPSSETEHQGESTDRTAAPAVLPTNGE